LVQPGTGGQLFCARQGKIITMGAEDVGALVFEIK
jgi:hypothetical protein